MAEDMVESFVASLDADSYPPADIEKIFGIEMMTGRKHTEYCGLSFSTGTLMYNVWRLIQKMLIETTEDPPGTWPGSAGKAKFSEQIISAILLSPSADSCAYSSLCAWFTTTAIEMHEIQRERFQSHDTYFMELERRNFQGAPWDFQALLRLCGWTNSNLQ